MAITNGFYNALATTSGEPDRTYDAEQMAMFFDGLIRDGVYEHVGNCFVVTAVENELAVMVDSGRCWFNHTWLYNDSKYKITLDASSDLYARYDSIVIEVNSNTSVRETSLKVLKGTPATNPVLPELTESNYIHQYRIANIYIAADTDTLSNSNIEYLVGTDETPYVSAPLTIISSSAHWTQWYTEAQETVNLRDSEFMTWFSKMKDQLDQDAAGHLQNEIDAQHTERDFTITTSWLTNNAYGDTSTYPYYQIISTTVFTDDSHPDCFILGGTPTSFMSSKERDCKSYICEEVMFTSSCIILLATDKTTVKLTLRVRGD
jgi:hypothetical protein